MTGGTKEQRAVGTRPTPPYGPVALVTSASERIGRAFAENLTRPGHLAKLLEASFIGMPRWGRVRIVARVTNGMARGAPTAATSSGAPADGGRP